MKLSTLISEINSDTSLFDLSSRRCMPRFLHNRKPLETVNASPGIRRNRLCWEVFSAFLSKQVRLYSEIREESISKVLYSGWRLIRLMIREYSGLYRMSFRSTVSKIKSCVVLYVGR